MSKIINPDTVAIESLIAKLRGIESQFTALEKKHSVLQDSIQSLNQTIIRADIKTNFFTDQLAFQLFCFSVILVVLGYFSWTNYLRPIQDKLEKLSNETIPNLINKVKEEKDREISEINKSYNSLKALVYKGYIGTLRQAVKVATTANDSEKLFESLILYIALDVKFNGTTESKKDVVENLNYSKKLINSTGFSIQKVSPNDDAFNDIEEYLSFLSKNDDQDVSLISFKILEKFLELKPQRKVN